MILTKWKCPICGREMKIKGNEDNDGEIQKMYVCECGYDVRTNSVEKCTLKSIKVEN